MPGAVKKPQGDCSLRDQKDELAGRELRVAIFHQGTVSDTGNSLGFGTEDENQGCGGLMQHLTGG